MNITVAGVIQNEQVHYYKIDAKKPAVSRVLLNPVENTHPGRDTGPTRALPREPVPGGTDALKQ